MTQQKGGKKRNELRELQSIRNLLILQLLKNGATSDEINLATGMGASNIRAIFPKVKKKGNPNNDWANDARIKYAVEVIGRSER